MLNKHSLSLSSKHVAFLFTRVLPQWNMCVWYPFQSNRFPFFVGGEGHPQKSVLPNTGTGHKQVEDKIALSDIQIYIVLSCQ